LEGSNQVEVNCRVEVNCTVTGQLPPRPAAIELNLTGDVAERSGLFDVGYFSLFTCLEELLFHRSDGTHRCVSEAIFRTVLRGDALPVRSEQDASETGRALAECALQICSILNLPVNPLSIEWKTIGDNTNEVKVSFQGDEAAPIFVSLKTDHLEQHQLNMGLRQKQTCRRRESFPNGDSVIVSKLVVSCSSGLRGPSLHPRLPGNDASGRVAYLQRLLKARGFVCTEAAAIALLDMWAPQGPDLVQVILRDDVWCDQLAFLQQNKNRLLDVLEDTLRTCSLLSSLKSANIGVTQSSMNFMEYPHTPPEPGMRLSSANPQHSFLININFDAAGNIALTLAKTEGAESPRKGRPFGGIRLDHLLRDQINYDGEGESGDEGVDEDEDVRDGESGDEGVDEDEGGDEDADVHHGVTLVRSYTFISWAIS